MGILRVFDQTLDRNGFLIFWRGFKKIFQEKKSHPVSMLTISGKNMKNFDILSCATYFRYGSVLVDISS